MALDGLIPGPRPSRRRAGALATGLALVCAALPFSGRADDDGLVDLVQPIVGTARKDQTIGAVNSGQTYPAVGVPLGMTHWTPQTQASEDKCIAPFYAQDERIQGIRASHWWSGSCTHDFGSATVAVITGDLGVGPEARASVFDRQGEFVKQVKLEGPGDALKDGLFFAGMDRLIVIKGYMESLGAQFGRGTTVSADGDEEGSYLAVVCYQLEK